MLIWKADMEQYRIVLIPSQRVTFLQLCSRASLTGASTIKAEQINGYHIAQGGEIGPLQAYQSEVKSSKVLLSLPKWPELSSSEKIIYIMSKNITDMKKDIRT